MESVCEILLRFILCVYCQSSQIFWELLQRTLSVQLIKTNWSFGEFSWWKKQSFDIWTKWCGNLEKKNNKLSNLTDILFTRDGNYWKTRHEEKEWKEIKQIEWKIFVIYSHLHLILHTKIRQCKTPRFFLLLFLFSLLASFFQIFVPKEMEHEKSNNKIYQHYAKFIVETF